MIILCVVGGFGALVKYIVKQHENEINQIKQNLINLEKQFDDTHEKRVREFSREIKDVRDCIQKIKLKMGEVDGRLRSVGDYHESLRLLIYKRDSK